MFGLNDQVMEELRPMHEEWAGVKLRNGQSYGTRVYKNGSTLVNHVDRSETHVIRYAAPLPRQKKARGDHKDFSAAGSCACSHLVENEIRDRYQLHLSHRARSGRALAP